MLFSRCVRFKVELVEDGDVRRATAFVGTDLRGPVFSRTVRVREGDATIVA
jgi:hypothetical protein